jgi:hypothetical protein
MQTITTHLQATLKLTAERHWTTLLIWAIVGGIAVVSCCLNVQAAHIGADYFPIGTDAFYHARRILDTVQDPAAFYEFDPRIHAPEGSLLTWPWGYDYLMAAGVRLALSTGLSADPLKALLWIPVVAVLASLALLILVARRLSLSSWPTTLAALCMALAPTTQMLHGFGEVDHHFAEMIFVLAALSAGLAWFRSPNTTSAVALGSVFGFSLAIHNGLFILQVPFLAALFVHWLQGASPPQKPTIVFAATLLIAALAVLLPSLPFRLGLFEFYTLSWFHLYVVGCTALVALLLARVKPTRRSIVSLVILAAVLLTPLVAEMRMAQSFLRGTLGMLKDIDEVRSPLDLIAQGEATRVTSFYSMLVWIAPATFVVCAVQCWRERRSPRLLFWIASVMGLALLAMQLRLHYFGDFALYLPWLVLLQYYVSVRADSHKRTFLIATLALLLAYGLQIRHVLIAPIPRGGDKWFATFHRIVPALREACARDPGVVLTDVNAGHYIRYYTQCSVIADPFLLTEQHFRKADEVRRLYSLPASELPARAPYVKYVLMRLADIKLLPDNRVSFAFFASASPQLAQDLLIGPPDRVPMQYTLLGDVPFEETDSNGQPLHYAKLFKIERAAASATAASSNDVDK